MATPITWRTVSGPSNTGAMNTLAKAGQDLGGAISDLGGNIKQGADDYTDANTKEFMADMAGKTAEQQQAMISAAETAFLNPEALIKMQQETGVKEQRDTAFANAQDAFAHDKAQRPVKAAEAALRTKIATDTNTRAEETHAAAQAAIKAESDAFQRLLGNTGEGTPAAPTAQPNQPTELAALTNVVKGVESNWNTAAVSPKGAVGDMQVMPKTLTDPGYGVKPAQDNSPSELTRVGEDYLAAMVSKYPGNRDHALAAYNWGPGNTDKWIAEGGDISKLPKETQDYIQKVNTGMGPSTLTAAPVSNKITPLAAINALKGKPNQQAELLQNRDAQVKAFTESAYTKAFQELPGNLGGNGIDTPTEVNDVYKKMLGQYKSTKGITSQEAAVLAKDFLRDQGHDVTTVGNDKAAKAATSLLTETALATRASQNPLEVTAESIGKAGGNLSQVGVKTAPFQQGAITQLLTDEMLKDRSLEGKGVPSPYGNMVGEAYSVTPKGATFFNKRLVELKDTYRHLPPATWKAIEDDVRSSLSIKTGTDALSVAKKERTDLRQTLTDRRSSLLKERTTKQSTFNIKSIQKALGGSEKISQTAIKAADVEVVAMLDKLGRTGGSSAGVEYKALKKVADAHPWLRYEAMQELGAVDNDYWGSRNDYETANDNIAEDQSRDTMAHEVISKMLELYKRYAGQGTNQDYGTVGNKSYALLGNIFDLPQQPSTQSVQEMWDKGQ